MKGGLYRRRIAGHGWPGRGCRVRYHWRRCLVAQSRRAGAAGPRGVDRGHRAAAEPDPGLGQNAAYHFVFTRQNRGKLDELSALVAQGRLRPHVGAVYALADVPAAHARLESRNNGVRGRSRLRWRPPSERGACRVGWRAVWWPGISAGSAVGQYSPATCPQSEILRRSTSSSRPFAPKYRCASTAGATCRTSRNPASRAIAMIWAGA